jgi:hypothetical protein
MWVTTALFEKLPKANNRPLGEISPNHVTLIWMSALDIGVEDSGAGDDVMITIFCDFRRISEKQLPFFSKTNVMVKFLPNTALF